MAQGSRKAGGGLARPVTPSADLAAITGSAPLPRSQVVSKVWDHIRKNNLQNPQNKREIVADSTQLRSVLGWRPTHNNLENIVASALRWEQQLSGH